MARAASLLLLLAGCGESPSPVDAGGASDAAAVEDAGGASDAGTSEDAGGAVEDAGGAVEDAGGAGDAGGGADAGPIATNAFIARTCGPADGLAIQVTVSDARDPATCAVDPMRPSTVFYIHGFGGAPLPPTAGDTISSTTAAPNGNVSDCPGGRPPCRTSEDWSLTFDSYTLGGDASGQYTISWSDGTSSSGAFRATSCETPLLCG